MYKDPTEFRKRFAKWKAGEKPYKNGRISDEEYVRIMEKVAADNWLKWGEDSEDAALTRILNDNAYDYRGYYSKYPNSAANADTHWSDEFKTVWHPTFSLESTYSGKKSQFNPHGYPGGTWQGEFFNPLWYLLNPHSPGFYKDGYPKLPRFATGTEGYKYTRAGKDFDEWWRITDDKMSKEFLDVVVRPKSRGGNTTEGSWRRLWSLKGEPGLETVSPEFFVISGGFSPLEHVTRNVINTGAKKLADKIGIFVLRPGTYTRGIGMTDAGVQDAIKSGVFRGNPRGTEQTAKIFDKMFLRNRNNFRDIVRDTKIKGIESRYQSRTLTEEDFNALKEASKKYAEEGATIGGGTIRLRRGTADPLSDYKNYQEYIDDVNTTIARTEQMRNRIASGEVQVNKQLSEPMWFEDESGKMFLPLGKPITERFGPNSDYVSDGNPLQYWYADGRNAITKGHPYARSNYMVRVNNPQDYTPFMHELHLHPSFFKTPKLSDPNVELFRRGPFGITIRMKKPTK